MQKPWGAGEPPVRTPDLIEPLRVFKEMTIWRKQRPDILRSLTREFRWDQGENEAAHTTVMYFRDDGADGLHPVNVPLHVAVPVKECSCGFYGYWLPDSVETAKRYVDVGGTGTVQAYVEVYGKVILHPLGVRAQKARIIAVNMRGQTPICEMVKRYPGVTFYLDQKAFYRDCRPLDIGDVFGKSATAARNQWLRGEQGTIRYLFGALRRMI